VFEYDWLNEMEREIGNRKSEGGNDATTVRNAVVDLFSSQ
jgi:hypothetical protein